jgi:hypothetical protein
MRSPGERIRKTRYIQTPRYIIAVEVEAVIPIDDPSEPCYESETVELLRQVREHADRGDELWLRQHGKIYIAADVA